MAIAKTSAVITPIATTNPRAPDPPELAAGLWYGLELGGAAPEPEVAGAVVATLADRGLEGMLTRALDAKLWIWS